VRINTRTMTQTSRRRRRPFDAAESNAQEGSGQHLKSSNEKPNSIPREKTSYRSRSRRRNGPTLDTDNGGEDSLCALALKVRITFLIFISVMITIALSFWGDRKGDGYGGGGKRGYLTVDETANVKDNKLIRPPPSHIEDESNDVAARVRYDSDAFGIARYFLNYGNGTMTEGMPSRFTDGPLNSFVVAARATREEFASRYGGENAARWILRRAVSTFDPVGSENMTSADEVGDLFYEDRSQGSHRREAVPNSIRLIAERILSARTSGRPFTLAFGGYSVTTGRVSKVNTL